MLRTLLRSLALLLALGVVTTAAAEGGTVGGGGWKPAPTAAPTSPTP